MKSAKQHFAFTLASLVVVLNWINSVACAHEFETGHIERSIDAVVRGQKIEVKYSIGLADETIVDWLVREALLGTADEQRFRKCIADLEGTSDLVETTPDPESALRPEKKSSEEKQAEDSKAAEPLEFQTELMELLRDKLSDSVCEKLILKVDNVQLEFGETSVSNSARHHVAMEITLKADLPTKDAVELTLVDQNFLEVLEVVNQTPPSAAVKAPSATVTANSGLTDSAQTNGSSANESNASNKTQQVVESEETFRYFGNIRLACRVKGQVVQLNSNVAPIIARAKTVDVGLLTGQQRVEAATIRTRIGFAVP